MVLASGSGTLFESLIDAPERGADFDLVALVTDQPGAAAIARAAVAGIQVAVLPVSDFASRAEWDEAMADAIAYYQPDWVVSAGFMRVLGAPVLERFPNRIINTHPALLPAFPGAHAVRDALAAGVEVTGSTVHFADAGVDTGPVIRQEPVAIEPGDDEPTLHERIKVVERRLLLETVLELSRNPRADS